jgi:hypothetical protein
VDRIHSKTWKGAMKNINKWGREKWRKRGQEMRETDFRTIRKLYTTPAENSDGTLEPTS